MTLRNVSTRLGLRYYVNEARYIREAVQFIFDANARTRETHARAPRKIVGADTLNHLVTKCKYICLLKYKKITNC